jgi:hypothetical protein
MERPQRGRAPICAHHPVGAITHLRANHQGLDESRPRRYAEPDAAGQSSPEMPGQPWVEKSK